jgi:Winged helix DNA-binding domain
MSPEVLSRRALNRALLSRQMLLDRRDLPSDDADARRAGVIETVEHLVGLQAQAPFPPYYGLWSRLGGFRPDHLAALITDRSVVRIALMRGTIHLVSARDCLPLRRMVQPVIERGMRNAHGKQLTGVDFEELASVGRTLVESEPEGGAGAAPALSGELPRRAGSRAVRPAVGTAAGR